MAPPAARITTRQDLERQARSRHIRYGVGALVALALAAWLLGFGGGAPARRRPQRLPPAPKSVYVAVTPPGLPGCAVYLTDGGQVQQVVAPNQAFVLELEGQVHWTVQAPGMRVAYGRFEVPYGPDDGLVHRIEVTLEPLIREPTKRPRFGRIKLGGAR